MLTLEIFGCKNGTDDEMSGGLGMKFIKLTRFDDKPLWIVPSKISAITISTSEGKNDETVIWLLGDSAPFYVKETPEEVRERCIRF